METDDPLIDIADAILEGRAVDWEAVETSDSDPDGRIVRQLRLLQTLAALHRQTPGLPGEASTQDARRAHGAPRWGHLRLHESVGRGAFGQVFRAWDTRLDREVALKLMEADSESQVFDSAVIAEGRLLARIRHPNVVAVYGAERIADRVGIWTEFVRGRTLEAIIREDGVLSPPEALAIGIEISRALGAVHDAGLLHRDVKAANVMRDDGGRIVLMDLGAGTERLIDGRALGREFAGTPLYVAPEVLEGLPATPQSDLYSVGVLLYHLVTGTYPVRAESLDEVRRGHREGRHVPLSAAGSPMPQAFVQVVDRALEIEAGRRFPSAIALEAALRDALQGTAEPQPAVPSRVGRWAGLWLVGMAALIAAAVAMVAVTVASSSWNTSGSGSGGGAAGVIGSVEPLLRRVTTPPMGLYGTGAPSYDGRLYVNTDLNQDLMVFSVADGTPLQLTHRGDGNDLAEQSILSPDGRTAAFEWTGAGRRGELRTIGTDGRNPRALLAIDGLDIRPIEWSRDGTAILCLLRESPARARLALVGARSGQPRVFGEVRGFTPRRVSLSPDSAFVVYDAPASDGSSQRDLVVQSTRGGPSSVLHAHPADDGNALWTPDGRSVFFVSDRSATLDGWIIPVTGGVAEGEPVRVARNLGRIVVSGFTASGALYYWLQSGDMDVFRVGLDDRARPQPPMRVVGKVAGGNSGPAWSPNGRYLAYVSQRPQLAEEPRAVIVVRDEQAQTERELMPPMRRIAPVPLRWSPDGRELLVRGDRDGSPGAYVLDVASGRLTPAVTTDEAHMSDIGQARWWLDSRSVAYLSPRGLVVRDLRAAAERVVFKPSAEGRRLRLTSFDVSPDRQSLAFTAVVLGTEPVERVLAVMPIDGEPRVLAKAVMPQQLYLQSWMPTGDELLLTRWDTRETAAHMLWRVSARDGAARDTSIAIPGFTQINLAQVSPGGTELAYTANEANWDLWVMEHFLSALPR